MQGYLPVANPVLFDKPPDFFARRTHFIDHLLPIWNKLDKEFRGRFYVPECLEDYAKAQGLRAVSLKPKKANKPLLVGCPGNATVVCSAYGDLEISYNVYQRRPLILMEHGVGLTFNNPGYAGGVGLRRRVGLFLAPNRFIRDKTAGTFPDAPQAIIGTPKMDKIKWQDPRPKEKPVIAIAFHWDGKRVAEEAGNALAHYIHILPLLAEKYHVIGHGHPKIIDKLIPLYHNYGITDVETDFNQVMKRSDIYLNDASSTAYEFATTGKPVILLNAPWFDRQVDYGIRWWRYTDWAIQVDEPEDLIPAIERTRQNPCEFLEKRKNMVRDLYPYLGQSADRAAYAITHFIVSMRQRRKFSIGQYDGTTFDLTRV